MKSCQRVVVGSVAILGLTVSARAQVSQAGLVAPPTGVWEGIARVEGQAMRILISLDSAAGRWQGTMQVPSQTSQSFTLESVVRSGDSLILRLPASAQSGILRFKASADGRLFSGTIEAGSAGTVSIARAGSREADDLVGSVLLIEKSRAAANRLAEDTPPAAPPTTNPDSARLVTSDIRLFWTALDRAPRDSLGAHLQREYLEKASVGVRDFIPGRIISAEDLAAYITRNRARYDSVRAANLDVTKAESEIRAAFRKLKELYPEARFPDVYFVIGRFNSGGTSSKHGLLIGAEMYRDPAALPAIVSHELIHFQQRYDTRKLLEHSFMEGSADFVGELISGSQINNAAHRYGMEREAELWKEFSTRFDDTNYFPWMYGRPTDGKPNDLGYFIGYRIAQAYYNKATDKKQALREIITARGGNVRELLAMSGYGPGK
jgi:hypothetical protein